MNVAARFRWFLTCKSAYERYTTFGSQWHGRRMMRQFTVSGSYGSSIFGGNRQLETNVRLVELPKETVEKKFQYSATVWPNEVHKLGAKYYWRKSTPTPTTFGHMVIDPTNNSSISNVCIIGSPDSRNIANKTIENCLYQHSRGFAAQLILHGRGVKAYFEPEWPHLHIRLGVGSKPVDVTRIMQQHAGCVKANVDKSGTLITVHGYDKCKVGNTTTRLLRKIKANPYTMKGGHLAYHPIKQKLTKKK